MKKVYPVLLAGGFGTRLWPLSRKSFPKQFSKLMGDKTLFQQSALRLTSSDKVQFSYPITLTNSSFRFIVRDQLKQIGIDTGHILIEPNRKNTAPAILAASIFMHSNDHEAVLLVAPSDHIIEDKVTFHLAVSAGLSRVQSGEIVTFGIMPTRPETGYGYLELSQANTDKHVIQKVLSFVEKPNRESAKKMLEGKNFLWNAGIFLFKAKNMIEAFKLYAPETFELVSKAVHMAKNDLGFIRLEQESWSELKDISIDYAIMEKVKNLVAVPYNSKWSDLGGWDSVWSENLKDTSGNVTSENAHSLNCINTLLRSESSSQQIIGLGLENIIAIAMPDAVLIANKENAQDVKKAVDLLETKKTAQATIFPKDHRPWGWFERLAVGDTFQVKRIYVNPGSALSLQSHKHRSEHWIVVEGEAKVTINDKIQLISEGMSVYVPLGSIHRLENPGKLPLIIIETQIGIYLGEDDIVRYEDIYSRSLK